MVNWKIIIGILLIGALLISFYIYNQTGCEITDEEFEAFKKGLRDSAINDEARKAADEATLENVSLWSYPKLWLKSNVFLCKDKSGGILARTKGFFKDALGANENIYDFFSDLLVGAFTGLWLWIMFQLAGMERLVLFVPGIRNMYKGYGNKLKASWLGFIGSHIWKIIPIAVAYAVLMQIPVINSFIKVVTFEVLLWLRGTGFLTSIWNGILRSLILAFYIGLLPTIIEEYTRYRIRKRYYAQIQRIKFEKKAVEAMTSG